MKIMILGSSNSILKDGYVSTFNRAVAGMMVHNRSVGASPGIQYAVRCGENLSAYDYVIFDSIANEENLSGFVGTFDYIKEVTFQIFSTIAAQTKLVVLGFCNQRFSECPSAYYEMHKSIAHEVGGQFISAREFGNEHRGELPDGEPLYQDGGAHLNTILAREFGSVLLRKIQSLPFRVGEAENFSRNFSVVDLPRMGCGEVIEKSNSFTTRRFSRLYPGDTIRLDRSFYCLGAYVDALESSADLHIEDGGSARDISLRYEISPEKIRVKFVPFKNGAQVSSLSVVATAGAVERSPQDVDDPGQPGRFVTLEKLVCWTPGASNAISSRIP